TNTATKPINIGKAGSSISISISPTTLTIGESTTISGSLSPTRAATTVTIQYRANEGTWTTLTSVTTDSDGTYSYTWTPTTAGTYEIKASWEGDENTLPSESTEQSVTAEAAPTFPWEWLLIAGIGGIAAVAALLVYLKRKP
ncbi:MAG: Ig-like domain-containing protein, partial [Candidatus Bathyarchaeota archaeon]|nr:Ig-like domain-containing protein [Candidatus Bathyarchaeota archaeon]